MLNKYFIELVKKYSFIDDAKIIGGNFILYYKNKGKEKTKTLPIRVDGNRLQRTLKTIKKELGVKNEENEDKGISICAF